MNRPIIFDAHLDLAYNVTRGRVVTLPAAQQKPTDNEIPTVGLPDLLAGNVRFTCATIFCEPVHSGRLGYTNADEARAAALIQLEWYLSQQAAGSIRFVTKPADLSIEPTSAPLLAILLLEGADAFRSPSDVAEWFHAGLRVVGLAWRKTRYAGGTGMPGALTAEGVELVPELDRFGIIHDVSHLAEESFWQLLDLSAGPMIASHSNCRAIVPTDRQLSDDMIRALVRRGSVIGINFYDKFLLPPSDHGHRRATIADIVQHIRHICDIAGNTDHVGLGTDMDGGLGREQIPIEITTSADLHQVGDALSDAAFSDESVEAIMSGNWIRFFGEHVASVR